MLELLGVFAFTITARKVGLYWRNGGVHWPTVIAQVTGMAAALMWINAAFAFPSYVGPISNNFPGLTRGDLSWALGMIVGAGVYWALAWHGV